MKPTLKNKPGTYAIKSIQAKFADGKPLAADQLNFLAWHEKSLSNPLMDSISKYYLNHSHHPYLDEHSFLLPSERMNKEAIQKLKRRLQLMLQQQSKHVILKFLPKQFLEFKKLTYNELILFHGNQFITGAPFLHGGIPQIIYFQWGNLFGVAKYVVLAEERALRSNVLIYFEDMAERFLDECVLDFKHNKTNELKPFHQLVAEPAPAKQAEPVYHTPTPRMSLTINSKKDEEKK